MDRHVAEDSAGDLDVVHRRGRGVPADDGQLLELAHPTVLDRGAHGREGRVEAPVEAGHDRGLHRVEFSAGRLDVLHVQGDRLLAQDGFAGFGGGQQVGDVQRSGGADDDGVDPGIGEDVLGSLARPGSVLIGEGPGGVADGVAYEGQGGIGVGDDGLGVDVADTASADDGDIQHVRTSLWRGVLDRWGRLTGGASCPDGR